MKITRTEFVETYAKASGIAAEWAILGFIEVGDHVSIALPCGCEYEDCQGWAMVGAKNVLDHLQFQAPDALRDAYMAAVAESGKEGDGKTDAIRAMKDGGS